MFDQKGLTADWLYLTRHVWFNENRPEELGEWSTVEVAGSTIDVVEITRDDYWTDLKSRPGYSKAISAFYSKLESGEIAPISGERSRTWIPFTLKESATTGAYNAVEWYLGSHRYQITILNISPDQGTMDVEIAVTNNTGWESGTRILGSFKRYIGDSLLPNNGGVPTANPGVGSVFRWMTPGGVWWWRGSTYGQVFKTSATLPYLSPNPSGPTLSPN